MKSVTAVVLLVLGLAISICVAGALFPQRLFGKHIAGQVSDAATGKPIEGAYVAYLWRSGIVPSGFTGHNARDICYHASATNTDANGRFDIPAWTKWTTYSVHPTDPIVLVYVPKYDAMQQALHSKQDDRPADHMNERYVLKSFSGNTDQRLEMLFFGLANQGCDYGGESQKSLYPMLKAIYEEARGIASTANQRASLGSFALQAAYAALALDPNGTSRDDELKRFIEEHLK